MTLKAATHASRVSGPVPRGLDVRLLEARRLLALAQVVGTVPVLELVRVVLASEVVGAILVLEQAGQVVSTDTAAGPTRICHRIGQNHQAVDGIACRTSSWFFGFWPGATLILSVDDGCGRLIGLFPVWACWRIRVGLPP